MIANRCLRGVARVAAAAVLASITACQSPPLRGTGDLGLVVERAIGRVQIVENTGKSRLYAVNGLGDLSHATAMFSRDGRYAFVLGRDGGLTKIDLLQGAIAKRVIQAGNSIGGAISQDGRLLAVANYEPGGVRIFDAQSLELVADIPATPAVGGKPSKVVGLVDVPGQRFVFSLYDAGEIWVADCSDPKDPRIVRFKDIGRLPYDGVATPDGRYYIAGLFGEDGLALLDLWNMDRGVRRILDGYGKGQEPLPVYKMPHLEGWATVGSISVVPAVGRHEVLFIDHATWREAGRLAVHGQPVFVVASPDGRQVWVNFAHPHNDVVQVIDLPSRSIARTLRPGPAVLHIEFTPRGEQAWVSVRDRDTVEVYDTQSFARIASIPADKPSGIFFASRANRIGY
jgi:protein NirF